MNKWIKASESEPKTMGYYFIKFLDIEDGEISKDVAEFIPGFAWPVPDGCEVVEWLDESQPQKEEVNEDDAYESVYMEVVELVEKDNIQCEFYYETAKKLESKYLITRK